MADFSLTTPPRAPPPPRHRQRRVELLSLTNENTRFTFAQLALPLKAACIQIHPPHCRQLHFPAEPGVEPREATQLS